MENTLENKEKFMTQYGGQNVLNNNGKLFEIPSAHNLKHESFQLVLRPLESITLEEIQLHFNEDAFKIIDPFIYNHKGPFSSIHYRIKWSYTDWRTDKKKTKYDDRWVCSNDLETNFKLKELGFLVPYGDLSPKQLVEYGWVKLKT